MSEKVLQTVRVSPELRKRLKLWSAETNEPAQKVFLEGLRLYAAKEGLDLSGLEDYEEGSDNGR